ncbi:MAG: hypothetical protein KDJ55_12190 [Rhodobiaceae bacterium]|nr:hypothetical protein [Rhodobiaceae bacterium]MCC0012464.1 hypothetical protein [Rhodobiaceae bacterium]MCC0051997.1 hypothetical protein [Rhodobiaceae bacterium]MCC0061671.1 hypothetical protein [Rhodobiaceae bacterium]
MNRHEKEEARRREALRDLERVGETAEVIGTSAFTRAAKGAFDHFSASDANAGDWTEVWGKRIARAMSLIILIALAVHLTVTYILK